MIIKCIHCNKEFKRIPSQVKRGRNKYCSNKCKYESPVMKNKIANKLRGNKLSPETIAKIKAKSWMNNQTGKNNKMWKGGISKTIEYKRHMKEQNKMRRKQVEGSHTFKEWKELVQLYKYMCLCCKKIAPAIILTEDHIIPISMGGTDYIHNIQPLCLDCNIRKNAKAIDYRLPVGWNG